MKLFLLLLLAAAAAAAAAALPASELDGLSLSPDSGGHVVSGPATVDDFLSSWARHSSGDAAKDLQAEALFVELDRADDLHDDVEEDLMHALAEHAETGSGAMHSFALNAEVPVQWPGFTIAVNLGGSSIRLGNWSAAGVTGSVTAKYTFGPFSIKGYVKGGFKLMGGNDMKLGEMIAQMARFVVRKRLKLTQEQGAFLAALKKRMAEARSVIESKWRRKELGLEAHYQALEKELFVPLDSVMRGKWDVAMRAYNKLKLSHGTYTESIEHGIIKLGLLVLRPFHEAVERTMDEFGVDLNDRTIQRMDAQDAKSDGMVRSGFLRVFVDSATKVEKADGGRTGFGKNRKIDLSDAYVKLTTDVDEQETKVVHDSLHPVWDETIMLAVENIKNAKLGLQVLDHDTLSLSDDQLSQVMHIDLTRMANDPRTEYVLDASMHEGGDLRIKVAWMPMNSVELFAHTGMPSNGVYTYKLKRQSSVVGEKVDALSDRLHLKWVPPTGQGSRSRGHWQYAWFLKLRFRAIPAELPKALVGEARAVLTYLRDFKPSPPEFSASVELAVRNALFVQSGATVDIVRQHLLSDASRKWRAIMRDLRHFKLQHGDRKTALDPAARQSAQNLHNQIVSLSHTLEAFVKRATLSLEAKKALQHASEAVDKTYNFFLTHRKSLKLTPPKQASGSAAAGSQAHKIRFDLSVEVGLGFAFKADDAELVKLGEAEAAVAVGTGLRGLVDPTSYEDTHSTMMVYKMLRVDAAITVRGVKLAPSFSVQWRADYTRVSVALEVSLPAEKAVELVPERIRTQLKNGAASAWKRQVHHLQNSPFFAKLQTAMGQKLSHVGTAMQSAGQSAARGGSVAGLGKKVVGDISSLGSVLKTVVTTAIPSEAVSTTTIGVSREMKIGAIIQVALRVPKGTSGGKLEAIPKGTFFRPYITTKTALKAKVPKFIGATLGNVELSAEYEVGSMFFVRVRNTLQQDQASSQEAESAAGESTETSSSAQGSNSSQ